MPPRRPSLRSLLRGALLTATLASCGVTPEPTIAAEFLARVTASEKGWSPVPCPDRAAKVEDLREVIALAHDLRARIRDFGDPLPPRLQALVMNTPLLGRGTAYRCVISDFKQIDLRSEPDYLEVLDFTANLFVLKATTLLEQGRTQEGWDHLVEAVDLYAHPVAPTLPELPSLAPVLDAVQRELHEHPPSAATIDRLVEVVDATLMPPEVACASVRHELLAIGIGGFRVHFGQAEREAVARRYGLGFAMKAWKDHHAGQLEGATWNALRDIHDAIGDGCTRRPYGTSLQQAASAQSRLDLMHPPTGVQARVASDRLNRLGPLVDAQVTTLAIVRTQKLRADLGREPTMAELALSFGRRPSNAWDGRPYSFTLEPGTLTVHRGPYQHGVALPPWPR